MLLACHRCHRQYDVGSLEAGRKVRCFCGELNEVPAPQVRDAEMLNCSNCGGDVRSQAKTCEYCGAQLLLADKGMGEACPECFARLVRGARFCSGCGTAIRPQSVSKLPSGTACPRCQGELSLCEIPGAAFTECTSCGGVWLEERAFEQATERQEESSLARYFHAAPGAEAAPRPRRNTEKLVQYLACPVCGNRMNRKNFAGCSGVIIDWCKGHGYWFDTDELEHVLEFVSGGGLEKARRRALEDQKREADALARRRVAPRGRMPAEAHGGGDFPTRVETGENLVDVLLGLLWTMFR